MWSNPSPPRRTRSQHPTLPSIRHFLHHQSTAVHPQSTDINPSSPAAHWPHLQSCATIFAPIYPITTHNPSPAVIAPGIRSTPNQSQSPRTFSDIWHVSRSSISSHPSPGPDSLIAGFSKRQTLAGLVARFPLIWLTRSRAYTVSLLISVSPS
jgi:hypothetical protein